MELDQVLLLLLTRYAQQPDWRVTRVGPCEKQAGQVMLRGMAACVRVMSGSSWPGRCT